MEPTEGLELRPLSPEHAAEALKLSQEAGWNQTGDDWRLMIALGEAVGMWAAGGRLAATALALPFGGPFAWISMVIVTGDYRHRGIATRLLRHCADVLRGKGLTPGLDATEAGRDVYLPLGFQDIYGLTRLWSRSPRKSLESRQPMEPPPVPEGIEIRKVRGGDLDALCDFDRPVFGADRSAILRHLCERRPQGAFIALRKRRPAGFVLARDGREAIYAGPLVAESSETAMALAHRSLAGLAEPVYMDVADRHRALIAWLAGLGFAPQRRYTRMILGRSLPFDDPERVFAIAGPELG